MKKEELKKALEIVKPGLAAKEIIEQSTSFVFMNGHVVTYNDELSLMHPVADLEVEGAIKAEELYSLINKIKRDELIFEHTENEIIIKCGRIKAGLKLQAEIKLPIDQEISEKGKFKKLPDNFIETLQFVMQGCSKDMTQPVLTSVHITPEGLIESCDNFRAIRGNIDPLPIKKEICVPASACSVICRVAPTKISEGNGWAHFSNEEGTILSCRIYEEKFPDASKIFENTKGNKLTLPESLLQVLERANIFASREHEIDECISFELKENKMEIHSDNAYGWFKEQVNVEYTGEPIEFHVTPYLIKTILSHTNKCILCTQRSAIVFKGKNWLYVSMLRNKTK